MGSYKDALAHISARAAERDTRLEKARPRVRPFLLGPGYPKTELELRRWLKAGLRGYGIDAIVMEDIDQWRSTLSEKFKGIIDTLKPDLFVAIFTRTGSPLGVTFELGFLSAAIGLDDLAKRLRFCLETRLDATKVMTAYVQEQIPMTTAVYYKDPAGLLRAVVNLVDNYIEAQGWI